MNTYASTSTASTEQELKELWFELWPDETEQSWIDACKEARKYLRAKIPLDGEEYCMHDAAKNGEPMCVSCPCPKCSPRC